MDMLFLLWLLLLQTLKQMNQNSSCHFSFHPLAVQDEYFLKSLAPCTCVLFVELLRTHRA